MSSPKVFNPKEDTLEIGGITVTGYADSKFTLTPTNGRSTATVGVDGDISVNIDSRTVGTLTVNLMQNSTMCQFLDAHIYAVQKAGKSPLFPLSIDAPTSGVELATVGWIETQADYETGQETSTRSYVIGVADSMTLPRTGTASVRAIAEYAVLGQF
jgi:hypothetical protein